jgi:hypothetical protein
MNALENEEKRGIKRSKNTLATLSAVDLMKMANSIGTFGGSTDVILRFRNGQVFTADTADQGGGQN